MYKTDFKDASEPPQEQKTYGYARMPRIIRKGYKDLSKLQKLLYIYLRDLCGENGMCYRSLRTLAKETDFCISYLSDNIPKLAEVGLITAEMRKHNGRKWEIWHISIVDIWEANAQFIQSEKCSRDEQNASAPPEKCSPDEQIQPESVHHMNTLYAKCSPDTYNRESIVIENPLLDREDTCDGDANASHHDTPTVSPSRKKGEKKKHAVDLDHVEVLPPPAKPDESMPWTARKVLAWGDFFRGYVLPESSNGKSHYKQNEDAAIRVVQRSITEKDFVSVFRFMLGKKIMPDGTLANDVAFRDEWWPEHTTADVRHVETHFTDMDAKIKGRGKSGKGVSIQQQLYDKEPDFPHKTQAELANMMPAERKEYSQQYDAYTKAKREREERAQSERQQAEPISA